MKPELSFRDTVALMALREFLKGNQEYWKWETGGFTEFSESAYQLADAMVKERGTPGSTADRDIWFCLDCKKEISGNGGCDFHKVLIFPKGCKCNREDWALAPDVPPICSTYVHSLVGDLELCGTCEHTKECHQ